MGVKKKAASMRLLLFSGFLGSGKTTAVLQLASIAAVSGQKVAILVNEVGEIGIDNQLMRQLDLDVWELLNGCICCTLSADLVSTLEKLDHDYAPDLILIEPSGAADPRSILSALPYYKGTPFESMKTVSILDPLRIEMLMEVMSPLISSQIRHADIVLISKSDLATSQEIALARRTAQEINPRAQIYMSNAGAIEVALISKLLP